MWKIPELIKGMILGLCAGLIITGISVAAIYRHYRENEIFKYAEAQTELQDLREFYRNRPLDEFLDEPDVRGAVDGARADFERKRDELLRAIRQRRIAK